MQIIFLVGGCVLFCGHRSGTGDADLGLRGGDDVNPCSRTAPCKTFAGAISKTAEDGEINCLDPGGYGTINISKSITIDCTGTFGSILSSLTTGVTVNITSGTDTRKTVVLRGLQLSGVGTGINGIRILSANSVTIENTVIDGFTQHGISIETILPTKITVSNTSIRNNAQHGINSFSPGGMPTLSINDSHIIGNSGNGLNLAYISRGAIRNSTIGGNAIGILAAVTDISLMNCKLYNNSTALQANGSGVIRISGNMITNNNTGLQISGGTIVTSNNNAINGNVVNGAANSVIALQ